MINHVIIGVVRRRLYAIHSKKKMVSILKIPLFLALLKFYIITANCKFLALRFIIAGHSPRVLEAGRVYISSFVT